SLHPSSRCSAVLSSSPFCHHLALASPAEFGHRTRIRVLGFGEATQLCLHRHSETRGHEKWNAAGFRVPVLFLLLLAAAFPSFFPPAFALRGPSPAVRGAVPRTDPSRQARRSSSAVPGTASVLPIHA